MINLNKNSWHYILATRVSSYQPPTIFTYRDGEIVRVGNSGDLCTYSKYVLGGLTIVVICGLLTAIIGSVFMHIIFGAYFSILLGTWVFSSLGELGLFVISLVAVFFTIYKSIDSFFKYLNKEKEKKPDGFLSHLYIGWKERFCVSINFKD